MLSKFGNIYRWIYGHITGKTSNYQWVIEGKLAGSAVPTSEREIQWLYFKQGIRSIVTVSEKRLPSKWFENGRIKYFFLAVKDYGAPSPEKLDGVVNQISSQIDNGNPVMVHCCGGKGRTGTIIAGYLMKKNRELTVEDAIQKLKSIKGEAIESKEQKDTLYNYDTYLNAERSA